jgi:DnaJ-class molecular chaperone
MARSGQCRTCRGFGKIGEMKSKLVKGQLIIIEVRRNCFTCQGKGRL